MKYTILSAALLLATQASANEEHNHIALDVDNDGQQDFKLYTRTANLDAGHCKILSPGSGAQSRYYSDTFKIWSDRGDCVVAYDNAGDGWSYAVSGWNWAEQGTFAPVISSLTRVIEHYGLDGYTLIGFSLGGEGAAQAAHKSLLPSAARIAIINSPPLDFVGRGLSPSFNAGTCAADFVANRWDLTDTDYEQSVQQAAAYFKGCKVPSYKYQYSVFATAAGFKPGLMSSISNGEVADGLTALGSIAVPVLITCSDADALVNCDYIKDVFDGGFFSSGIDSRFHNWGDYGHAVMTEAPAEFVRVIDKWIESTSE